MWLFPSSSSSSSSCSSSSSSSKLFSSYSSSSYLPPSCSSSSSSLPPASSSSPRDDLELGQLEKKHKIGGRREEGGLLPPLLALAPQDRPPSPPHPLKMDYLCSAPDQLSSQYLQDATMDYNNIDY